jgi:predicted Zn-dependent peptidase
LYRKTVLGNGLRVITSPMPHTRSVSVCIFIGVGSRYESDAAAGISHFIEHLLFKGTEKRAQARDIAAAIEGVGGIINAGTDRELTIYWIKAARPHFQLALDVLVDMLTHSRLEPGEVEKERQVIIEEIHMVKDSPHQSVGMLVDELLWPNHPLGRDVAGTPESVSGITREMITDFVAGRYHPGDAVVSVAGAISHEEAVEEVDRLLGGWGVRPAPPGFRAHTPGANPRLRVEARDTEQTHLSLALPGLPLMHPKRYSWRSGTTGCSCPLPV